jgi:hypothetical protein
MSIAFMSVAFGRIPGMPIKLAVPTWIAERHLSPGSQAARDRYRH